VACDSYGFSLLTLLVEKLMPTAIMFCLVASSRSAGLMLLKSGFICIVGGLERLYIEPVPGLLHSGVQ